MLTPIRLLCWLLISLAVLIPSFAGAEPNTGGGPSIFNCTGIPQTCGAWAPKGANTCRTCKQALCKNENGKEVLAGNKTETECYQGHGPAPLQRGKINVPKAPTSGLKQQNAR